MAIVLRTRKRIQMMALSSYLSFVENYHIF